MNVSPFHPVTQFNSTQPCRPHQTGQADRDASYGIHRYGCDNNEVVTEQSRQVLVTQELDVNSRETKSAAAPAAASGACICGHQSHSFYGCLTAECPCREDGAS